ncbi:Uncharacterised protein [Mycobacterium tuberculosis]|nr:Uncharacterised protein [Mycobacterium tuberculosis]
MSTSLRRVTVPLTMVASYPLALCRIRFPPAGRSQAIAAGCNVSAFMSMTLMSAFLPRSMVPRSVSPNNSAVSLDCLRITYSSGSFSPRCRSRAQCVSKNVGYEASQIIPQCAPPSDNPSTPAGCSIISRMASWLPSA